MPYINGQNLTNAQALDYYNKKGSLTTGEQQQLVGIRAGLAAEQAEAAKKKAPNLISGTPIVDTTDKPGSVDAANAIAYNNSEEGKAFKSRLAAFRASRRQDMDEGRARGEQLFSPGSLGRVSEGPTSAMQEILASRKANLAGYTPEEQTALRENNVRSVQQNTAGAVRDLMSQQARSGVRGPAAVAQRMAVQNQANAKMADLERQLFIDQISAKRTALSDYEQAQRGSESSDLAKQQYNQAQAAKEKYGVLGTEMGYGSLGSGERASALASAVGEKQASAMIEAARNGGKK